MTVGRARRQHSIAHQKLHRLGQPAAVPVVFPLRAVGVLVRNLRLFEPTVQLFVMRAKAAVTEQAEALVRAKLLGMLFEQLCDLVIFKILLRPENRPHAELIRASFHQRCVPGRRAGEGVGVPQ